MDYFLDTGEPITGTLIWYSTICPREVWLMSRNIAPDESDAKMDSGRALHATSYSRGLKEVEFEGIKIDLIRNGGKTVCEIKSSRGSIPAARLQVLYYLARLREFGIIANGEVLVPKSKTAVPIVLGDSEILEVEEAIKRIREIAAFDQPPKAVKIKYCNRCAYRDFCWGLEDG